MSEQPAGFVPDGFVPDATPPPPPVPAGPPAASRAVPSMSAAAPGSAVSPESATYHAGFQTPEGWHSTGGDELHRQDNQVLGMPPEFAALSALAVARAAAAPAANLIGRAKAALGAFGAQTAPWIKYEGTRRALNALGVSDLIAVPIAAAVSQYNPRRGMMGGRVPTSAPVTTAGAASATAGASVDLEATAAAARSARAATFDGLPTTLAEAQGPAPPAGSSPAPAAPAPRAGSAPPPTPRPSSIANPVPTEAPGAAPMPPPPSAASSSGAIVASPQRVLNDLAIAARRAKVVLTADDYKLLIPHVAAVPGEQSAQAAADAVAHLPALKLLQSPGFVSEEAMRADMAQRAMRGQKSLMGEYVK